ncbi:hypothetical protein Tco_1298597, partial [Tanacetum coccineum]
MLDRTDFESWQQRIRLYCLGKDNGENIMKSIKEGPFQMGTVSDVITGGTEGAVQQGPVRARVLKDLSAEEKESSSTENLIESLSNSLALLTQSYKSHLPQTNNQLRTSSNARNNAVVQDGKVVVQDSLGMLERTEQRDALSSGQAKNPSSATTESGAVLDEEQSLFLAGEQVTNVDDNVDDSPENDLALNVDHVFEADECNAFDYDVDEGPITQTMFMTNLTSEDLIYDEAGTSYDSNTPFEVHDHDTFENHLDEYHEVHEMQTYEQHNYVVDYADYTSNSNNISYDQYMEDNEDHVVQRDVSSVRNDALMSILDEMHEQGVQSRLANK